MRLRVLALLAVLLVVPSSAHAATAASEDGVVRVVAAPGERNAIQVELAAALDGSLAVSDAGAPLQAGAGCGMDPLRGAVVCPGPRRIEIVAGDGDDQLVVAAPVPARLRGGQGDDTLSGGARGDRIDAGSGDDSLSGGSGNDRLLGRTGRDSAAGGRGNDAIVVRDRKHDAVDCGRGRDHVRAEVLDSLDFSCERVDYGPAGRVGRLRAATRGRRFVSIPGQRWARVDRRILADVLYLVRRYRVRITEGLALSGHSRRGEHPLGLAVDIVPGPGGSWGRVDRLARWAERRQNRPRPPFRWVGYRGDPGHGRGDHLHLSWMHTPGRPGRPVRKVWVWEVRRGRSARAAAAAPLRLPAGYPRRSAGGVASADPDW